MFNQVYPYYELPQIESLWDMVKKKVIECPEGIAFAWYENDQKHSVTYKKFSENVCIEAQKIKESSDCGSHIGILGENSYEWLVVFMATIFSGNIAVPLDKDMTEEELCDIVCRMDIALIMTNNADRDKSVAKLNIPVLAFDDCLFNENPVKKHIDDFKVDDHDKVCVIFLTSGTAGKRKGVMLSHRNIASDINGSCRLFELNGDTLAALPFHHAFGLMVAVWMVFHYGYTVNISQGLRKLHKEMQIVKPQTMMLVPMFVETFLKYMRKPANKSTNKDFFGGNLEYIICGGAPLEEYYVKEYRTYGIELLNGYGTTECSPVAAVNRNYYHKDGTVGIPIPESKVKISGEGEVLIFGSHVMVGYYKDPKETKEVLRNGWYYTGDLGQIDSDGFIKLTGRKKNLIILSSGENVVPEELESKLVRIDGIDEVIVLSLENEIAAEIYSKHADSDMKAKIREEIKRLNKGMPMFKRITRIVFRNEEFPKTTSQKIKRRTQDA